MSIYDRQYIYNPTRLNWINSLENSGYNPLTGSFDSSKMGPYDANAAAQNYKWLTQGEAGRTAYMNNFLGGGAAGPAYGGIVSGPEGPQGGFTQGDRAIKAFQHQWDPGGPMHLLQQLGINLPVGGGGNPRDVNSGGGSGPVGGVPNTTYGIPSNMQTPPAGARLDARGNPYAFPGTNANMNNMNPASMMEPGGVMGQISNDFGWNPNSQPMMNNPGWGQTNDYWGNGW